MMWFFPWFITWFITWLNQNFQPLNQELVFNIIYNRYKEQKENISLKDVANKIGNFVPVVTHGNIVLPDASCCCICLENINQGSNYVMTNCGHIFHRECSYNLAKNGLKGCIQHIVNNEQVEPKNLSCPLCRSEVTSLMENSNDDDDDLN
jgi:hypothetical protein